ncbi:hypothetical protein DCAR_0417884 [Daucus carota subsp. sativus]|uniref:histone acetyltransferase n=1 Tax=Daucus carota subsp. sativus TaxID=79200 RepID=A0AAF0X0U8_DAUCS|nr:hypothetical protein DCAR_0417884 [Daucus carota subsp. sativus]
MNLHTHRMSAQGGGGAAAVPVLNGSSNSNPQIQASGGGHVNLEPDYVSARRFMTTKIYEFLMRRQPQANDRTTRKVLDVVKRLEEGLFRNATTKEEYMNLETLENRLRILIRREPMNNPSQQYSHQHINSSSSTSTMIPTPGMPQSGNSSLMHASSVDSSLIASGGSNSIASSTVNTGSFLPTGNTTSGGMHGGSFNGLSGSLPHGYQQSPSTFSISSGGNIIGSSVGGQRIASQMIPTPGFNSSNNINSNNSNDMNNNNYNQPVMNLDSNNMAYSTVETTIAAQPLQQKNQIGGQNSRILHNLGSQIGGGIRSGVQQKYGLSSGSLTTGLGTIGNNIQISKGPGISEGYINAPLYGNSSKLLQHDQHQRQISQGTFLNTAPLRFQLPHHLQQQRFLQQQRQHNLRQQQHVLLKNEASQGQMTSNVAGQVKCEPGIERQAESLHSQFSGQFQSSEVQYQNLSEDQSVVNKSLSLPPSSQEIYSAQTQTVEEMQQSVHQPPFLTDSCDEFTSNDGVPSERVLHGQWRSRSQDGPHVMQSFSISKEHHIQGDFSQRTSGQGDALQNNLSSGGSIMCQNVANRTADPRSGNGSALKYGNANCDRQFKNQLRWLLFLRHARACNAPKGRCPEKYCVAAQELLRHVDGCFLARCPNPRCPMTKRLIEHHKKCKHPECPVCIPVKNYIMMHIKARAHQDSKSSFPSSINGSCNTYDTRDALSRLNMSQSVVSTSEDLQPSLKRMKIEQQPSQSNASERESCAPPVSSISEPHVPQDILNGESQTVDTCGVIKTEVAEIKIENLSSSARGSPGVLEMKNENIDKTFVRVEDSDSAITSDPVGFPKEESIKTEKEVAAANHSLVTLPNENVAATKSGKPNIQGVSLTELFTPEQVREHIKGLRQWVGQSKAKAEKNQAMENSMSENSCQLCAVEKLTFEPPPIYCTPCGARIKRNAMYYTIGTGDTRHYFCIPCHNDSRGETIIADGTSIPKARLEKKKNDEDTEEWWVQCDKCEAWQHQICALFNGRRNDGGQAEYTCPNCYIAEVERGERMPLPQSAVLGAKDLPRTILSDHIEQRLFKRLKQERMERARVQGKSYDEVPGADFLVIRVVSSVDKKLDVKPRFLDIFQEENYPTEFGYKSKVVLLFQKIEGVEVCLFGMYVQEFGAECQQPNHRRVYLSYLDSVKYFRPEIRTVTGEALRTFVYHEILIGYLEYCKKRGFTSCYIWACPPLKGEDYILYCHPEIQKTPKSDKLREWYLSMLRKAAKEDIVVELTNLYDHFFVPNVGECKAKVTAARLPYFDGDYWPGAAEDIIYQLQQEEDGRKLHKRGLTKKTISKRALKAFGQADLSGNASKDLLLMHRLGETISPMKEDFIMVHLQHSCSHCCIQMASGNRWVCNQCKNFQLCDKCYEVERNLDERDRHPISNQRDSHMLHPVEIEGVPVDTKDKDEILESEFFDTRQAFLSLCQGNHYQYDTLRRAKHSSMMVLYHLHNPTAPAFVTTCNVCHLDIEAGQGWRCETCPDFDVCNACYQKDGGIDHPHKLTNHPSLAERDAQNKEARQLRVLQLRKMLDLLVHASQCRSAQCQYPNCRKVKGLFRHGIQCKTRASGGCVLCKKMWYLLQLHARACKESECHVPRCRDLKEHLKRLQQQSDSRRRAAVMEMMRQRAAEVAGNP